MKSLTILLSLTSFAILFAFNSTTIQAQTISGDRDSLIQLVDDYFEAMVAHDPTLVPLSESLIFVENIEAKQAGEGLWKTASAAPSSFKLVVPDPVVGQVGFLGMMEEDGAPIMIGIRLKVVNSEIVEAEHVIARDLREGSMANLQTPRPGLLTTIPEAERVHRDTLLGIGASYYLAVDYNLGSLAAFADDCVRRENGFQTSTNPPREDNGDGLSLFGSMGCSDQLDTRVMSYIDSIDNVRVFAADPVTGLSMGFSHFRHSMINSSFDIVGVPGIETREMEFDPFDLPAAHVFKISDGQIHEIEAMGFLTDYNAPTGW